MKTNSADKTKTAILVLGRWDGWQDERVFSPEGISTTLDTNCERRPVITTETNMADKNTIELPSELKGKKFRIRKLTPRECLRLMGFDDSFKLVVSDTELYKQAGNSIVVDVLMAILKQMDISQYGIRLYDSSNKHNNEMVAEPLLAI